MYLAYGLFAVMKETLFNCLIKQVFCGNTKIQYFITMELRLQVGIPYIFSQRFSMATFLNKVAIPAQPCSLAFIQEQNSSWQKILTG